MATAKKPPKTRQTTHSSTTSVLPNTAPQAVQPAASVTTMSASQRLSFTKITGTSPSRLTKIIGLHPDNSLRKESVAQLYEGTCCRVEIDGLDALRIHLDSLTSAQALTWGITHAQTADLCTEASEEAKAQGAIARTRENFRFPNAPGLLMLDHDGLPAGSLTLDEFRSTLLAAVPALTTAPMLGRPSASRQMIWTDFEALCGEPEVLFT